MQVAGTTGNVRLDGDDDEEGASTEEQGAAILAAFGYARRNEARMAAAPAHARMHLYGSYMSSMAAPRSASLSHDVGFNALIQLACCWIDLLDW